jgi:hypothetical protein
MSDILKQVQALIKAGDYIISRHGYRELADDVIMPETIIAGLSEAVVIEEYPDSRKEPSILVLQFEPDGAPVHVMWGIPKATGRPAILVTAYRPKPERWSTDFKRRNR